MTSRIGLYIALVLCRRSPTVWILCALLLVSAIAAALLPSRQRALEAARLELNTLRAAGPVAATKGGASVSEERFRRFQNVLGTRDDTEKHVAKLLAIAHETRVPIVKAEYRRAYNESGRYYSYQVTLPFRGGYEPVRRFCEEVLRVLPFASIDAVVFSRHAASATELESKVIVTFFLSDTAAPATAGTPLKTTRAPIAREAVIR